jgi:hypothetical protein
MMFYHHALAQKPAQEQWQHVGTSNVQDVGTPNQIHEQSKTGLADDAKWQITFVAGALRLRRDHCDPQSILRVGLDTPGKSQGQFHGYGFNTTNHGRERVGINQDVHE